MQQIPAEMTVVEISRAGGPEVLVSRRRPVPSPGPGEVLIQVQAAGVNGPDIMQRKGLYPAPAGASDLPGLEVSGEITRLGDGASRWKLGDTVTALTNGGGYAEYCVADARHCLPVPHGVSVLDAAGVPETFFTVWSNIFDRAGLRAGETLLVHGGAGGIGSTAIQLAKAFGAKVFTTDSPAERCAFCQEVGADRVIDYRREDFVEVVRSEAGGANVILDVVGGPYVEKNIKASSPDGRIVQVAFSLGSKIEIDLMPIMLKRLTYTGSTLRTRPSDYKAQIALALEAKVWPFIEEGRIRAQSKQTFPLVKAADAHALMENARHIGKIILVTEEGERARSSAQGLVTLSNDIANVGR
ncbi:NAD(P)H-quinone oxidoreductase [Pseudorhodoplanes sp.]|uniref:NAD(P)H-quinone oxidoreductase n=1 Tax=Pseudorhodoplanes sp. TaxID=1934341 RepID=UPI003D0B2481